MTRILTESQWNAAWDEVSAGQGSLSLCEYAEHVDRVKRKMRRRFPQVPTRAWSNGRYDVYLEYLLQDGMQIPRSILRNARPLPYHDTPLLEKAVTQ